jgi:hypothetical protein
MSSNKLHQTTDTPPSLTKPEWAKMPPGLIAETACWDDGTPLKPTDNPFGLEAALYRTDTLNSATNIYALGATVIDFYDGTSRESLEVRSPEHARAIAELLNEAADRLESFTTGDAARRTLEVFTHERSLLIPGALMHVFRTVETHDGREPGTLCVVSQPGGFEKLRGHAAKNPGITEGETFTSQDDSGDPPCVWAHVGFFRTVRPLARSDSWRFGIRVQEVEAAA